MNRRILKQLALTEEENSILYELVSEKIKNGYVYPKDRDMIDIMRILLVLHDALADFDPPVNMKRNDSKAKKETLPNPSYPKIRRPSQGDLQT